MNVIPLLRKHGIQPTPQRIAVAEYVLRTGTHPTADEVWESVRKRCPVLSRATVYNTLNLLVDKGLLRTRVLGGDAHTVFDPHVEPHHHFVDTETGKVYDLPWDSLSVQGIQSLKDFDVTDLQIVLRGRKRRR